MIFYCEPNLRDQSSGHSGMWMELIRNFTRKRFPITFLISGKTLRIPEEKNQTVPFFTDYDDSFYHCVSTIPAAEFLFRVLQTFFCTFSISRDLARLDFSEKERSILLFPTADVRAVLGTLLFLRTSGRNRNIRAKFVFHTFYMPLSMKIMGWFVRNSKAAGQMEFFSPSDLLAKKISVLLDKECVMIPNLSAEIPADIKIGNRLCISYLGAAKLNKGFDLLPDTVLHLLKIFPEKNLHFLIQAYILRDIPEKEKLQIRESILQLKKNPSVELFESPLSASEYSRILAESNISLFPYDSKVYAEMISGALSEAMKFGTAAVVPAGTWLSAQIDKTGGGIVFSGRDEFKKAVEESIRSYPELREKANSFAERMAVSGKSETEIFCELLLH